jgi:hypothetical protein
MKGINGLIIGSIFALMSYKANTTPIFFEFEIETVNRILPAQFITGTYSIDDFFYKNIPSNGGLFTESTGLIDFSFTIGGLNFSLANDRRYEDDGTSNSLPNVQFKLDGSPWLINYSTSKILPLITTSPELAIITSRRNLDLGLRFQDEFMFCDIGDICSQSSSSSTGFIVRNEAVSALPDLIPKLNQPQYPPTQVNSPNGLVFILTGFGCIWFIRKQSQL